MKRIGARFAGEAARAAVAAFVLLGLVATGVSEAGVCLRTLTADVVAIDQHVMFNRLGAYNPGAMIYALRRDVVDRNTGTPEGVANAAGQVGQLLPGQVELRPDKRPRPIVLRASVGDCLQVNFQNLLSASPLFDDAVADRNVGFHPEGLELVGGITDDASFVGRNPSSLAAPGDTATYTFYAPKEGTFLVTSPGATWGGEGGGGHVPSLLFGAVNVQPRGAAYLRSQVTEEDLALASMDAGGNPMRTPDGHPIVNYDALYPNEEPWITEGKAGTPILRMVMNNRFFHSDLNAIVAYDNNGTLGNFPPSTYPLESIGKSNPSYPNRLEPFREYTAIFHDETDRIEAFPGFFGDRILGYTLHGVGDVFMINYGSGGIGSEIIANRLGVGPMHDCLDCKYEEFFLSSYTVGDPAMVVDKPANFGLERLGPGQPVPSEYVGPKAQEAFFPDDPSNVHHGYINDFVKFRNLHAGPKEHHIFHLHTQQWLFNPNDDDSNYLDSQGLGPGSAYTYEIVFGGAGNRNKTPGDAIFHCHFYPHFAQGMWELMRDHDVFEPGTPLAVSVTADNTLGFHTTPFALQHGKPAPLRWSRALPDGEIVAGTPIPAVVPLPGKPMPPMPGRVEVVPGPFHLSGQASVDRTDIDNTTGLIRNPGYPFFIAGIEGTVGQRVASPALDMAVENGVPLNGGLPRHTLGGIAESGGGFGVSYTSEETRLSFSKTLLKAKPYFWPEDGTDVEKAAMAYHALKFHPTYAPDGTPAQYRTNGNGRAGGAHGAPFADPCVDDNGNPLDPAVNPAPFFRGPDGTSLPYTPTLNPVTGQPFNAVTPRQYKAAVIQLDVQFNKVGWHFPQQRILSLWGDVADTLAGTRPPEPMVLRLNTFDCAEYWHTNLVPGEYKADDFQITTPTDIIGQHIHLVKFDVTSSDGSANGWNYEDGTLSPDEVRERIAAINRFDGDNALQPQVHPFFGPGPAIEDPLNPGQTIGRWLGARTTVQRWLADPVVNRDGKDRGLGIVFTHDHFGPSTHQQVGLYASVLIEPAQSEWKHNESGDQLYSGRTLPNVSGTDGGPTSWQAAILNPKDPANAYREFYFEFSDFQHAYEAGAYYGTDRAGHAAPPTDNSYQVAINPTVRGGVLGPDFYPDVLSYLPLCPGSIPGFVIPRPCPQAISADDPGVIVVNYRQESLGLRVFDPAGIGPDGNPGTQAAGPAGDFAFALQTRTDRAIPELNTALGATVYPPLTRDIRPGDPFTPIMRVQAGDKVRVKMQAGANEESHNATINGLKWLQEGSGFGESPNSGWRNAQHAGISEQFTFTTRPAAAVGQAGDTVDHFYTPTNSLSGLWNGDWGVMRVYSQGKPDLFPMPDNPGPIQVVNPSDFNGACPVTAPVRSYDVTAVAGRYILPVDPILGIRTLVYNPRQTVIPEVINFPDVGAIQVDRLGGVQGPLHDPTALMYVRTEDLEPDPARPGEVRLKAGAPIEPLVLRAAAGDCLQVTLRNRIPPAPPDMYGLGTIDGIIRRTVGPLGVTSFNFNLIRPSSEAGLHPQLVFYDMSRADGVNVGINPTQTVPSGGVGTFQWYAGDVRYQAVEGQGPSVRRLVATPVEFGTANLMPADPMKHPMKGLVGNLVIEPQGSAWTDGEPLPDGSGRRTRASTTVTQADGSVFRDFSLVFQTAVNLKYANPSTDNGEVYASVENLHSETGGVAEDAEDAGGSAFNYRTEPMWFRAGLPVNLELGLMRTVTNMHEAYSNTCCSPGGVIGTDAFGQTVIAAGSVIDDDPVTPIFTAVAGTPVRMRVADPGGNMRNRVFTLHGHLWQRQPYLAGDVPSQTIGDNPLAFYRGAQEGIASGSHFDIVLPSAGGAFQVPGDYLYRDQGSFGNFKGLWGLLRVSAFPTVSEATLSATPPGSATVGTGVVFTASATGGTGPFEYEFQARVAGGTWVVPAPYGPGNTWTWNTTGSPPGGYEVKVNVRNAGSTAPFEARATIPYTLTTSVAAGAGLSANPTGSTATGNSVMYTASAVGGTGPFE